MAPVNSYAKKIGVFPSLSLIEISPPFFNNFLIKLGFSVKTATCNGVLPSLFLILIKQIYLEIQQYYMQLIGEIFL